MYKVIAVADQKLAKFFQVSHASGAIKVLMPRAGNTDDVLKYLKSGIKLSVECHFGEHECVGFFNPCSKLAEFFSSDPKRQILQGNTSVGIALKEVKSCARRDFYEAGEQIGVILFVTKPYHDLMKTGSTRGIDSKVPKLIFDVK